MSNTALSTHPAHPRASFLAPQRSVPQSRRRCQNPHLLSALFAVLLALLAASSAPASASALNGTTSAAPSSLWSHCERFHAFEPGIAEDLLPWYDNAGISESLMDRTLASRTMRASVPGLPLAIRGGKLFVIDGSAQSIGRLMPWQADNIVVYAHALSRLVSRWGSSLPDVEFVVETMDTPFQDLGVQPVDATAGGDGLGASREGLDAEGGVWAEPHGRLPVMRHCKTASSPDITIPTFHFYTLNFDDKYLFATDRFNREHPWPERQPAAFAAGTGYHREQRIPSTTRQWDGVHSGEVVHNVRSAFSEYLVRELRHPNITYKPGALPIEQWAKYKMVMHMDGIACSSRLWQLLALGSAVLREQSGYFAFYDKLLRKFHHYVPFWMHRPREVVWAFNWVTANDEAASAIAARGQAFVREYLNREALECFWALLLRQYARLLRFTPGERRGGGLRATVVAAAAAAGQEQQQKRGEGEGQHADTAAEVRQLEMVPIAEWLAAQDGRVIDWPPNQVVERLQHLHLLPEQP